jgi:peptidoglycan/xylan/chitin deacetylase (PgdA/CDA1 family)
MIQRPRSFVVPVLVGLVLGLTASACGLGDLPTRRPSEAPPATATPSPVPTATPEPTPVPTATPKPTPTPIVHVVKRGENLIAIARRYKTTPQSIGVWNRKAHPSLDPTSPKYDPNRIEIGWRLTIFPGVTVDPNAPESPEPTPEPTLELSPSPTAVAGGPGVLLTHGPRASNAVALTFDMGDRTDPALAIVHWLIDRRVPATFFATGELASGDPTAKAVLALVGAHPDLFAVGNGTWDHPDLTALAASAVGGQLERADTAIAAALGTSPRPIYRPPDGAQNATVRAAASKAGYPYTVMWDIDTTDAQAEADGGPSEDDIVARVDGAAQGGSIVLMHLGGWNTLGALPGIVADLADARLIPVTVPTLLGL